jgi:uncharacterized membrane protein
MASTARTSLGLRLGVAVVGAAVATVLTAATAGASPPTAMGGRAPAMTRLGAGPSHDPGAGSPPPGFLLERGRFTPVVPPPGLEDLAPTGLAPFDLNDRGQIVGPYEDLAAEAARGFLLTRGRLVKVDVPGAKATQPQGINNRGQIVGKYSNTTGDMTAPGALVRGFLLDRGRYVRLDVPGAVTSQAFDLNDRGQVVGEYRDADGVFHGYMWERGRFKPIDVPGQPGTTTTGINHRGQITGITGDPTAPVGFLLDRGRVTTFTVPGAQVTFPLGINDRGQIVGYGVSGPAAPTISGFLRDARGRLTAINRPGAAGTTAFDINNRGQIVGFAPIADAAPSPQPTDPAPMGRMA